MYEPSFRFYDNRLWEAVKTGNPHVHMFFRLLALCHTVMPEDKDGMLYMVAQKTLCCLVKACGCIVDKDAA